jgi:gas vesicle protein
MSTKKSESHLGVGVLIGTIMGVATGLFLQSKSGKMLVKDAEKKGKKLQAQLLKELKDVTNLSQKKYVELVDRTMGYYLKSKEIAEQDMPQIRKFLISKWSEIEKHVKKLKTQ